MDNILNTLRDMLRLQKPEEVQGLMVAETESMLPSASMPRDLDLAAYRLGQPQRSGPMTVVPVFGPQSTQALVGPLSSLKLSQVRGYGNMELTNPATSGVAIVPLHMGFIQDRAQNHALCRSAFIAAGQSLMFNDACCVQAGQGGYLAEREQWFFILPVQLRAEALRLRGQAGYNKLWTAIGALNQRYGLPARGHLEQIVSRSRPYLTQYQSRFELLPAQVGAIFFIGEKLAGIEIAPTADYFREMWMPLVCFGYGTAAMYIEQKDAQAVALPEPFAASDLAELQAALVRSREERNAQVQQWLVQTPAQSFAVTEEERFLDMRLHTAIGTHIAGQYVTDPRGLVYASLFATPDYLFSAT